MKSTGEDEEGNSVTANHDTIVVVESRIVIKSRMCAVCESEREE